MLNIVTSPSMFSQALQAKGEQGEQRHIQNKTRMTVDQQLSTYHTSLNPQHPITKLKVPLSTPAAATNHDLNTNPVCSRKRKPKQEPPGGL